MRRSRSSCVVATVMAVVAAVAVTAPAIADTPDTSGTPLVDGVPWCGVAPAPAGAPTTSDDGVLRVGTFNLLHSDTDEGDLSLGARLPLEARSIAAAGVDVLGVQEATRNETFDPAGEYPQKHGFVVERLAQQLARRTGDAWEWCWSQSNPHVPGTPDVQPGGGNPLDDLAAAFGNTPDPGDFREGLGVLTRFDIDQTRFRRLPPRSYEAAGCVTPDPFCRLDATFDSRQVLWAHVLTPGGALDLFTTHIAHGITPLSDTTKLLQVQEAVRIVDEWATPDPWPDFLVGDFNSSPSTDRYAAIRDAGFVDTWAAGGGAECNAPRGAGCTGGPPNGREVSSPTRRRPMGERIDYVFARPPDACALGVPGVGRLGTEARSLADGRYLWPSDHLGVVSTITC